MTRDTQIDGEIANSDKFTAVLEEALEKAVRGGVDIDGVWHCQPGSSMQNWEIEVIKLASDADD